MNQYPKVEYIKPIANYQLLVRFSNQVIKLYDCSSLLEQPPFSSIRHQALFQAVQIDKGGYGIFWNEELDLSESELWIHGQPEPNLEGIWTDFDEIKT